MFKILKQKTSLRLLTAPACFVLLASLLTGCGSSAEDRQKIASGISWLKNQENGNTADVKAIIRSQKAEKSREELDEKLEQIDSGSVDIWSLFDDVVILGDSRADDFEYNGFLPRSKILAALGDYSKDALSYLDSVSQQAPHNIVFTYGMNDVDGIFNNAGEFKEAYADVIRQFQERLPDSLFYVCSIIPVNEHALENDSDYQHIPEYNEAIRQMCSELGVDFIDLDDMLEDRPDLYDTDGQHFFPDAYPIWGKSILRSILTREAGIQEASAESIAEIPAV